MGIAIWMTVRRRGRRRCVLWRTSTLAWTFAAIQRPSCASGSMSCQTTRTRRSIWCGRTWMPMHSSCPSRAAPHHALSPHRALSPPRPHATTRALPAAAAPSLRIRPSCREKLSSIVGGRATHPAPPFRISEDARSRRSVTRLSRLSRFSPCTSGTLPGHQTSPPEGGCRAAPAIRRRRKRRGCRRPSSSTPCRCTTRGSESTSVLNQHVPRSDSQTCSF
ncbi:hypothetical protein T484DRAFT_1977482 [Baffinella frigidus]|nr:hypothetical protein T484DRAFT_1977482 [Cryptophyta sp. CCMP2293]